jgi:hypothetical protein
VAKAATMVVVGVLSLAGWELEPLVGPLPPIALVGLVVGVAAALTPPPWERLAVVATVVNAAMLLWSYASQPTALPARPLWAYVGVGCLVAAVAALGGTIGALVGARRSAAAPGRRSADRRRAAV